LTDKKGNVHSGHRKRLRKRFAENGLNGFCPHEILEFILFYSIPRANTNEIAHDLINHFGNVYEVLQADPEELCKIKGINSKSIDFIKIFNDICHYYLYNENLDKKPTNMLDYVKNYFSHVNKKMYLIININPDSDIKGTYTFTPETFNDNQIIQNLVNLSVKNHTNNIIISHNCQEGHHLVPSREDFFIVRFITENLKSLGIRMSDYIISNGSIAFSMYKQETSNF